jgi:hypothetical protein
MHNRRVAKICPDASSDTMRVAVITLDQAQTVNFQVIDLNLTN